MSNECSHKNLLVRDGVSQTARLLKALDPSYAEIDEKTLLDLLTFIKNYAGELTYYNQKNKQDCTWEIFFQQNCVSFLADIDAFDTEKAQDAFKDAAKKIKLGTKVKENLKSQFDLLITLIFEAEKWRRKVDKTLKLYNEIFKEISASLSLELLNVISYYKKAIDINLINQTDFDPNFPYTIVSAKDILLTDNFSDSWFRYKDDSTGLAYNTWSDYYGSITKSQVYDPTGSDTSKGKYSQYFLQKSFDKILSTYTRLLEDVDSFLKDMLTNYPSHEPHMGLLLSFLQLFKYAQNRINKLTKRHLNFYLKDVLGLKKMKAVADKVHIIFELAKGIETYKVKKNTALSAGKDDTGKEVLFYTNEETVFNTAAVGEIRNIYIDNEDDDRVYASPYADSPDGLGSDFTEDPGKWKPFGESQEGLSSAQTMPDASIGFMIASEAFQMTEGIRKIKIDIHCDLDLNYLDTNFNKAGFDVYISGKEAWIKYTPTIVTNVTANETTHINHLIFNTNLIQLLITIPEDIEPISAVNSTTHDTRFDVKTPVVFLECSHSADRYIYKYLKNIVISKIQIKVVSEKTKTLLLQNDQTVLDPSKPFNPFGTIPKIGSSFMVGSKEVFNKNLTKLTWNGTWNEFPEEGIEEHYKEYNKSIEYDDFTVSIKQLLNGEWEDLNTGVELFVDDDDNTLELTIHDSSTPLESADLETLPDQYDIEAKSGFIKIELEDNDGFAFGHQLFPKIYAETAIKQSIALAKASASPLPTLDFPNEPYTPAIKDFYIAYTAIAEINFGSNVSKDGNDGKFYQVHPFGYKELKSTTSSGDLFMLPQFTHLDEGIITAHNGELMIGFKSIKPPTSLNLLFKVAEGSENPEKLAEEISWFYLEDDEWTLFESSEVLADKTKNLTTTGILSLSVPRFKSLKTKLLQKEELWIMGSVSDNTDAACDIIKIHPQAILAKFKDNGNDPTRTGTALKAKSISKLKIKDESIKAVSQPYASFDGKTKETSDDFYLRTSERLRHKDRGVTIWDYERIILQEFPELYKVKCINHTAYGEYTTINGKMDSEFAPGYVTVIVVPKTYNKNAINPYEPKVTKAKILEIEAFIKKRISPFTAKKIKVLNPLYEQIKMEFEVEFYKKYSDRGYYEKHLNTDIKKYLSPWAYSEGKDLMLGGRLHKSVIIDYIEELYYVDYLKDVKMHHYIDDVLSKSDINTAYPSTARSVFVTINDAEITNEHIIKEIT